MKKNNLLIQEVRAKKRERGVYSGNNQEGPSSEENIRLPSGVNNRLMEILGYFKDEGLLAVDISQEAINVGAKRIREGGRLFWSFSYELVVDDKLKSRQVEIWEDTGQVKGRLPEHYVHSDKR